MGHQGMITSQERSTRKYLILHVLRRQNGRFTVHVLKKLSISWNLFYNIQKGNANLHLLQNLQHM